MFDSTALPFEDTFVADADFQQTQILLTVGEFDYISIGRNESTSTPPEDLTPFALSLVTPASDAITATENGPSILVDVLANDDDVDSDDDSSTLKVIAATSASGASVSFTGAPGDGISYDPDGVAAFESLAAGSTTTDTITYTIEDSHGATDTATSVVTIIGENDAPVAADDSYTGDEDSVITGDVIQTGALADAYFLSFSGTIATGFGDIEVGDAFAGSIWYAPDQAGNGSGTEIAFQYLGASLTIDGETVGFGPRSFTIDNDGSFAGDRVQFGSGAFSLSGLDFYNGRLIELVDFDELALTSYDLQFSTDLSLWDVERLILFTDGADIRGDITSLTLTPPATLGADTDPDIGDALNVVSVNGDPSAIGSTVQLASGALLTMNADGAFNYDPNGAFDYLGAGESGTDTFIYEVSDGNGGFDSATVTLLINGLNDDPTLSTIATQTGSEDVPLTLTFADLLADSDATDDDAVVAFKIVSLSSGSLGLAGGGGAATVGTLITADQAVAWTPPQDLGLTAKAFYVVAVDQFGNESGAPVSVNVNLTAIADAPLLELGPLTGGGITTPVALTGDIQVNTTTSDVQQYATLTALSGGGFVITWSSQAQDGDGWGIFAQRYDASGAPLGAEFQVNTETTNDQNFSSAAALEDGGFVVTWSSQAQDGSIWGIFAQRYDASGATAGSEFQVNTTTFAPQEYASITGLPDGGFVIAWSSQFQDADNTTGVYAQRYDATGAAVGSEFQVSTAAFASQSRPAIAALSDGGLAIAWEDSSTDGSGSGVFGQIYDSSGATVGGEFRVNSENFSTQREPSIAGLDAGGFVVAWFSLGQDGSQAGIFAKVYDGSGALVVSEFQVNTFTTGSQTHPTVAALSDGGFLIVWSSVLQDSDGWGVYGQRFDADGGTVGSEFLINETTAGDQIGRSEYGMKYADVLADGTLAVAWSGQGTEEVFVRLFDTSGDEPTENTPFNIPLTAELIDTDGSEELTLTLSGFPPGSTFSLGAAGAGDTWVIGNAEAFDLSMLEMTPPLDWSGTFTLTAAARATEATNGDFAETVANLEITVASGANPLTSPVRINGIDQNDQSGYSVASAGDVDGDGLDDVIIGANGADPDGVFGAGESYLIFGATLAAERTDDGEVDLSALVSSDGVVIKGAAANDQSGISVSSAGDVDGDGLEDLIIGAPSADPSGGTNAGETYLVFGAALAAEKTGDGAIDLATLTTAEGVRIKGADAFDLSGASVAFAGDVDGDGLDDVVIGAEAAGLGNGAGAGSSYVIFGSALNQEKADDGEIDLATLAATEGVLINGIDTSDLSGRSVASAGDVDGDGLADIIIGAAAADPYSVSGAGESYLVFGAALAAEKAGDGEIDLATLAASDGVIIKGIDADDQSGWSVASAGDVDGDGLDDVIIGAIAADPGGLSNAGESYVIFGAALAAEQSGDGVIDLATLTAADGVLIKGKDPNAESGRSVASAGDVDGDGLGDVIIGAPSVNEVYLVFGAALATEKTSDGEIDLATFSAIEGVLITGIDAGDLSGWSVASIGDVDGDGLDDVTIGAVAADPYGVSNAGESYVISGAMLSAEKTDDGVIDLGDYFIA